MRYRWHITLEKTMYVQGHAEVLHWCFRTTSCALHNTNLAVATRGIKTARAWVSSRHRLFCRYKIMGPLQTVEENGPWTPKWSVDHPHLMWIWHSFPYHFRPQAVPPVEFTYKNDRVSLAFVEASIQNPVASKGSICKDVRIYPAECRGRRCTYRGKLVVCLLS